MAKRLPLLARRAPPQSSCLGGGLECTIECMGEVRRTLIPQFSLRLILGIVAALAVVAFVTSTAGRGWAWATGVSIGLLAIVIAFVVYALLFSVAWLLARLLGRLRSKAPPASTNTLIAGWLTLLGSLAVGQTAWGASGGAITLPILAPNQANTTGLELTIDTTWVDSFGYRPVRVAARSIAGPVVADRVLTIRFRPRMGYTQQASVEVIQILEMPAGSSAAQMTISVPQEGAWGSFELDVLEDKEYVDQLSIGPKAGWTSWSGTETGDRSLPVVLALGDDNRKSQVQIQIGGNAPEQLFVKGNSKGATQSAAAGQGFAQRDAVSIEELPTDWIDYSGVDLVLCSRGRLRDLATQFPGQWNAIRDWVRSGGNLIVYGAGKDWDRISQLEQTIEMAESEGTAAEEERDLSKRGWILPVKSLRKEELDETAPESAPRDAVEAADAPFVTRPFGMGMVVAIRGDNTFDGGGFHWTWLLNTLGPERWQWYQRWGLSLAREFGLLEFFDSGRGAGAGHAISGVHHAVYVRHRAGELLRAQAMGQIEFDGDHSAGRGAGGDGRADRRCFVGRRVGSARAARSVTSIDQRSGEAACWARLSYYAGLAPGGGLKFSEDTAVLPLETQPESSAERRALRVVEWRRTNPSEQASPLEQRLTDGWLPARTPTQFVTSRIGKTKAMLDVKAGEGGQSPQIVNHLARESNNWWWLMKMGVALWEPTWRRTHRLR